MEVLVIMKKRGLWKGNPMFRSIRWRLIFSTMFITLLTVGVVGALTYQLVSLYVETREEQSLRTNAEAVAVQAEALLWGGWSNPFELQPLSETAALLGDVRVRIYDAQQRTLADSGLPGMMGQVLMVLPTGEIGWIFGEPGADPFSGMVFYHGGIGDAGLPSSLLEMLPPDVSITVVERQDGPWGGELTFQEWYPAEPPLTETQADTSESYRSDTAVTVPIGDPQAPLGYVELSSLADYGSSLLGDLRQALVTAGFGALAVAGLFGLWNSQKLAAPLKSLARTSAQMGAGDLSVRANVKSGGEIGELADQFNQMAGQVQTSFAQLEAERDTLRRFIADASHELRTPITVLKNFNTLLRGSAANDPQASAEFLAESQTQIERLEWITRNLLDLSRRDAGLVPLELTEYDLSELIEAAAVPFMSLAAEKSIGLITQLPDTQIPFTCDRAQLEMALSNLLDNALKFTPENGAITVSLERVADRILVLVCDTGVGIPPEELPHIFKRFYRGRAHTETGSGLGLAIVKSIVEAHRGTITVESTPGTGSVFTLTFAQA
jgi:signal transduction histidine kinase